MWFVIQHKMTKIVTILFVHYAIPQKKIAMCSQISFSLESSKIYTLVQNLVLSQGFIILSLNLFLILGIA